MTDRSWTFRTAATVVAIAAASATFSTFAVAQAADKPAQTSAADRQDPQPAKAREHDFDGPYSRTQDAQREEALQQVIAGQATVKEKDGSKVVQLKGRKGDSKYVELGREKTDKIFTILVEFGDQVDPRYGGTPGPLHNRIEAPDRKTNNSTDWQADFDRAHYQDLYFGDGNATLKSYYEKQSSGRYSVDGEVTDWVKVPYNEARYGSNDAATGAWYAVQDGVNAWVAEREAAGDTAAEISAELAEFDQWDRYDFDGDGDFNEPDGYIDHFQIVHAGEDESAGGGAQGEDAIWAHRWYAFGTDKGVTGPDTNKRGGTQIGDTGVWVGDYTIQPENGGLGVFAHEYGHDLGLPDEYDTSGGGENSTGFWTLMSSGSWLGTGKDSIGDLPGDMNAWDKLQLGWLDYEVAKAGKRSSHKLGVAEYNTKNPQALVVQLPKKSVTTEVTTPAQGATQWWSDTGDDLENTLTRTVDLTGKSAASLTLDGWWDIEQDYDYLYAEVSTDGGANYTPIDGTLADGTAIPRDGSGKPALTGSVEAYQKLTYPLNAYAGKKVSLRFRYATDGGTSLKGFAADEITVTADGTALFSDNAESADTAWTAKGFRRVGASFTDEYAQYYIAENRQYVSYDKVLKVGPYNYGFSTTRPDWVEHYAYQNGLLIWKWDTSQKDDNTSAHPGRGLILPIDSHPTALKWSDGTLMRNRIQAYDSTFSWYPTDGITLHKADVPTKIKSKPGVPVFDDGTSNYYDATNPLAGVNITDTNTRIKIVKEPLNGSTITLQVGPSAKKK
ncbi:MULTISPECIES: immune inhibitor A domain-containing protein [unclassified Streptomyces]|uniref:immune inhibitor A domain-containing protein n=1 Tax=unclassified Streptomyces TaxID=2593676 RepID=UPI002476CCD0|nr:MULTISPECIES: immune inhibitor A domain-containing protein [unclassified Streptomyces]MDH6450516.1 immune inhibitor A [Streptomyces sp. SAI-119]MDH6498939.1 immune inhibitor A [Streptomyces sp. SAI-149]